MCSVGSGVLKRLMISWGWFHRRPSERCRTAPFDTYDFTQTPSIAAWPFSPKPPGATAARSVRARAADGQPAAGR
jgi:hypothetical protein